MSAGAEEFPRLLSSMTLRGRTLRNRVVFCAHLTNLAADQLPGDRHAAYYEARARGGAGLIITEEHTVHRSDRPYEKLIRGYDPAVVDGYRAITDRVHAHGSIILAQLNHNGAQGSSMHTRRPLLAPSAVWDPMFREVPKPLDHDEIAEIVLGFAKVAHHCREGGFDGVELQCSQASLIRAFLAAGTNLREDEYGGSLENRSRFLQEVIGAVRAVVGPDLVLGVRLAGDERVDGGISLDEAVQTARMVEATGEVDYINTSIGLATSTLHLIEASMATPAGYALYISSAMRDAVDLPVMGVGRFATPADAEAALRDEQCDLVGVVRGQIADPDFARKAAAGRGHSIRVCSACNQECIGRVGFNHPIRCLENPRAGLEGRYDGLGIRGSAEPQGPAFRTRRLRRVVVVGAGPAGMQAAAVAAERGHDVTLLERDPQVGGQIALASRAPYRDGLAAITQDLERRCRAAGVRIECGAAADARGLLDTEADAVVLATGAQPDPPAWARGLAPTAYSDVRAVLGGSGPAGRALVVDGLGFHPATSVAEMLAQRGCAVTVCTDGMVVGQDLGVTLDREGWMARAHEAGIAQRTDTVVAGARTCGTRVRARLVHHPTGAESEEEWEHVVYAGQQRCDDALWRELTVGCADSAAESSTGLPFTLHRIGDALAPRRAHAAIIEGERIGVLV